MRKCRNLIRWIGDRLESPGQSPRTVHVVDGLLDLEASSVARGRRQSPSIPGRTRRWRRILQGHTKLPNTEDPASLLCECARCVPAVAGSCRSPLCRHVRGRRKGGLDVPRDFDGPMRTAHQTRRVCNEAPPSLPAGQAGSSCSLPRGSASKTEETWEDFAHRDRPCATRCNFQGALTPPARHMGSQRSSASVSVHGLLRTLVSDEAGLDA